MHLECRSLNWEAAAAQLVEVLEEVNTGVRLRSRVLKFHQVDEHLFTIRIKIIFFLTYR